MLSGFICFVTLHIHVKKEAFMEKFAESFATFLTQATEYNVSVM